MAVTTASVRPGRRPLRTSAPVRLLGTRREWPILLVSVLVWIYFAVSTPGFASGDSFQTLLTFVAPVAIVAVGLTPVIIAGEIDVSVGQTFALAPVVLYLLSDSGVPVELAAVLALIACAAVGAANAVISSVFRLPSFVVTLGMYFVLAGLNVTLLNAPVETPTGSDFYGALTAGPFSEILWALVLVAVLQFVLSKTRFGMRTVAIGANPSSATELGISALRVKAVNFMVAGAFAGLAGILESVRVSSTDPGSGGPTFAFQAIAAVVIGGTLLAGGSGTVVGSLIGALFLGLINQGFSVAGVSAYLFNLIVGIAILIALALNASLGRIVGGGRR